MSEKFNLMWNDFQSNISKSFKSLRQDTNLFDVALISSDHKTVPAHKVVLSACSELFKTIFNTNVSTNMCLYLDCATSKEIGLVLDYIYQGEVQLYQEELEGFLGVAKKLKLDGLLSSGEKTEGYVPNEHEAKILHDSTKAQKPSCHTTPDKNLLGVAPKPDERLLLLESTALDQSVQCNNEQVEEKFQKFVLKEDRLFRCTFCNKTMPHRSNMKKHLETHLSGLSHECPLCGQSFRSENAFLHHKRLRCAYKV